MLKRKGLGKGLGKGYKNIVPRDPFIHGLSAKGIKYYQVNADVGAIIKAKSETDAKKKFSKYVGKTKLIEVAWTPRVEEIDREVSDLFVIDAKKLSKKRIKELEEAYEYDKKAERREEYEIWKEEFKRGRGELDAKGVPLSVFNVNTAPKSVNKINKNIKAPVISSRYSTLGGEDRVTILISLSLDKRSTWYNDIFENSRYMHFHLDNDGTLEQFGLSHTITKKFRKTNAKSVNDAIEKINKYILEVR